MSLHKTGEIDRIRSKRIKKEKSKTSARTDMLVSHRTHLSSKIISKTPSKRQHTRQKLRPSTKNLAQLNSTLSKKYCKLNLKKVATPTDNYIDSISKNLSEVPSITQIIESRVGSFDQFVSHMDENSTEKLLQILNDIILNQIKDQALLSPESESISTQTDDVYLGERIIEAIEAQTRRITSLNSEIEEAIHSNS